MRNRLTYVLGVPLAGLIWLNGSAIAIGGIHLYQQTMSPLVARAGVKCRFTPTCSRYAEGVIAREGLAAGGWKTLKRVARCGPWTKAETVDEP